jgi:predicted GIY-YIG superfamily endonuclease
MTIGVYKLILSDGSFYIGRSCNIEKRFSTHLYDIKHGKSNKKLLAKANEGVLPIAYEVLEKCNTIEDSKLREVHWINELRAIQEGLNVSLGGEDILYGESNASSKYSNAQILEVLMLLAEGSYTLKEIEEETGVAKGTLTDITTGSKHLWLQSESPELYQKMQDNASIRKANSLANLEKAVRFKPLQETYPALKNPSGEKIEIEGTLTSFAQKYNLQIGNLSSVINGRRKSHKGWTLYRENAS